MFLEEKLVVVVAIRVICAADCFQRSERIYLHQKGYKAVSSNEVTLRFLSSVGSIPQPHTIVCFYYVPMNIRLYDSKKYNAICSREMSSGFWHL